MLHRTERNLENIPVGALGIIALTGCEEMGQKVNDYIVKWRKEDGHVFKDDVVFTGYEKDNYLIHAATPRFGSGEAKGVLSESIRGKDIYLMVDVCNYSLTYSLNGQINHMSPDDHFQNLKRIIAAIGGKARRVNVIMPFLYESRQHKRTGRESLDCALALEELTEMGVENIITFDAHDPRVQNAIPLKGFETVQPVYQFIKYLLKAEKDLQIDSEHMMVISPDEGGMTRAVFFANVLGLDMGMFYKRRDYTKMVDGRNPIVAHEFLGTSVEGKDVLIIDDIQNIIGRQASIEFFFQLVDEFIRENKKIVIASDRAPKKLEMDERLTSRFNSGMLCLVSEPSFETKYRILKYYYENTICANAAETPHADGISILDGIALEEGHLTDDHLRHMADISGNNIRELESFCERCAGLSYEKEQAGGELTATDIDAIADEYFDTARKKVRIDTVQGVVEEFYHVSHEDMISRKRTKNIAFPRHVAIYLANSMCELSLVAVGEAFGRNHTRAIHSIEVVEKKMKEDARFGEELQQLRNVILIKS